MRAKTNDESESLEKKIATVMQVEVVAFGLILSAISAFNQISFGLAQLPNGKFYGILPLGPTMWIFTIMVVLYVMSLSTGLASVLAPTGYAYAKFWLILFSVVFLIMGLILFTGELWYLHLGFFYGV